MPPAKTNDSTIPDWVRAGGAPAKLAWVQSHIEHVAKTGRNTHQKFDYMQEHGLIQLVRPFQRELRFALVDSVVDVERDGNSTRGTIEMQLIDVEQPPTLDGQPNPLYRVLAVYPMEATDNQGWGSAKLLTYAKKFALQKFLQIPTEDLPEAEKEAIVSTAGTVGGVERPITAAQAKALGKALKDAVGDNEVALKDLQKKVKAKLVADFGCDAVSELRQSQLEDFQAFVVEITDKAKAA